MIFIEQKETKEAKISMVVKFVHWQRDVENYLTSAHHYGSKHDQFP